MPDVTLDVWLYGNLARYGGDAARSSFANVQACLPEGSTMADLLSYLNMPTEERGITFVNGELSAMPGLQPDMGYILHDGDRVAFFHLKSMWPFQYRHGVPMIREMAEVMHDSKDQGLHHAYSK
jgi:hypothetical protein